MRVSSSSAERICPIVSRQGDRCSSDGVRPSERSNGLGFDRVIIYSTKEMMDWLNNAQSALRRKRAQNAISVPPARHAEAVVYDPAGGEVVPGFTLFQ